MRGATTCCADTDSAAVVVARPLALPPWWTRPLSVVLHGVTTGWWVSVPALPFSSLISLPPLFLPYRDVVEELEAEASHQKAKPKQDPLDQYCEDTPEADECRTYDN